MIRGLLLLDDSLWRPPADSIHYTLLRQADARHIQMYGATNFSSGTTHLKAFSPVSVLRLSKHRLQGDCGRCRFHGSSVGDDKHCSQLTAYLSYLSFNCCSFFTRFRGCFALRHLGAIRRRRVYGITVTQAQSNVQQSRLRSSTSTSNDCFVAVAALVTTMG